MHSAGLYLAKQGNTGRAPGPERLRRPQAEMRLGLSQGLPRFLARSNRCAASPRDGQEPRGWAQNRVAAASCARPAPRVRLPVPLCCQDAHPPCSHEYSKENRSRPAGKNRVTLFGIPRRSPACSRRLPFRQDSAPIPPSARSPSKLCLQASPILPRERCPSLSGSYSVAEFIEPDPRVDFVNDGPSRPGFSCLVCHGPCLTRRLRSAEQTGLTRLR